MERSDFWTHVGLVVGTLVLVIIPGYLAKGFANTMVVFLVGMVAVIGIALWSRRRTIAHDEKGEH